DGVELSERADVDLELTQGGARILEQAPLEARIDPGPGNHLGTEGRGPTVHEIDLGRDLLRGEHALLDQQATDCLLQHLIGTGWACVVIFLEGPVMVAMLRPMTVLIGMLGVMHGRLPIWRAPANARRCRLPTGRRPDPSSDATR